MTKQEIIDKLTNDYQSFATLVYSLNDQDFIFAPEGKWSAGQQLDHIIKSIAPLVTFFSLPKMIPGLVFGKSNRETRDYETIVAKYKTALEKGGKASGRFVPKPVSADQKEKLKNNLLKTLQGLTKVINHYDESQLDKYLVPHPLLGKMTAREMLYFTIYHVAHHRKAVLQHLGRKE